MSRFRRVETGPTRDMLPPDQQQPQTKLVPVTAEQAGRRRRNRIITGVSVLAGAIALIFLVQKYSSKPVEVRDYLADAKRHFDLGKYSDALTSVDLVLRESGNHTEAYRLRAQIYRSLERRADAYGDVTRLIKLEPDVAEHYRARAQLSLDMDDIPKAIKDYTTLIERHKDPVAYTGRALCYRKLGETGKVIADLTSSIQQQPSVENFLQRGLAYESLKEHAKAIADYNEAIRIDPNASQVYRARAYARQAVGDMAGSRSDSERALTLETPQKPAK